MKVKELRKFLDDRGLPCDGCVEKVFVCVLQSLQQRLIDFGPSTCCRFTQRGAYRYIQRTFQLDGWINLLASIRQRAGWCRH